MSLNTNTESLQRLLGIVNNLPSSDEVYSQGHEAGKQSEYDKFWDAYQDNGNLTSYLYAFAGTGWNDTSFKPKYSINPTSLQDAFNSSPNLTKVDCAMNTANCTTFHRAFAYCSKLQYVPLLDLSSCTVFTQTFVQCRYLHSLSLVNIPETCSFASAFNYCTNLTEVTFEGTIGTDISFQWSPLSVESMKSIILSLKNYLESDTEYHYTITFSDECWAALLSDGTLAPNGETWDQYVDTLCWNY